MMSDAARVPFLRDVMIDVLTYHQRTEASGCLCGWAALGQSHAAHVVKVYEEAAAAVLKKRPTGS